MKKTALLFMALALLFTGFACTGRQAPSAATSTSNLTMNGGNSANGKGGAAGYLEAYTYSAAIDVNTTGAVDASFTIPSISTNYGLNKYEVSASQKVQLDTNNKAGALFMIDNTSTLYVGDGSGTASVSNGTAVTGLVVDSGVTLTLPNNYSGTQSKMGTDGDVTINGVLNSTSTSLIDVWSNDGGTTIGSSGTVSGFNAGGSGTSITMSGVYMINQGTITAKGDAGYNGGYVYLYSDYGTANTGTIDASGGDNPSGNGGSASYVELYSDYGNSVNSGSLLSKGGVGGNGYGGSGDEVEMYGCGVGENYYGTNGDVLASGTLDVSGGNGTGGNGGGGGEVYFETDGFGNVKVNATVNGNGGSGNSSGYSGGSGGYLQVDSYPGSIDVPTPGAIQLAGSYNFNGGDGAAGGGAGGDVYLYGDDNYNDEGVGPAVQLYSFGPVMINGGNGATGGGSAYSDVDLETYSGTVYSTSQEVPGGPIMFQPDLYMQGGNVINATKADGYYGGNGGYVYINAGESGFYNASTTADITGNLHLAGGTGDIGGYGAYAEVDGESVSTGNITVDGGAGLTTGGNADEIKLFSNLINTTYGSLSSAGGAGPTPGTKGTIYIDGVQIQ